MDDDNFTDPVKNCYVILINGNWSSDGAPEHAVNHTEIFGMYSTLEKLDKALAHLNSHSAPSYGGKWGGYTVYFAGMRIDFIYNGET